MLLIVVMFILTGCSKNSMSNENTHMFHLYPLSDEETIIYL